MVYLLLLQAFLLIPSSVYADKYQLATDKAQEAFFIQSGLHFKLNQFTQYVEGKGRVTAKRLNVEREVALATFGVKLYRNKALSFPIGKQKRLTLKPKEVSITIDW